MKKIVFLFIVCVVATFIYAQQAQQQCQQQQAQQQYTPHGRLSLSLQDHGTAVAFRIERRNDEAIRQLIPYFSDFNRKEGHSVQ